MCYLDKIVNEWYLRESLIQEVVKVLVMIVEYIQFVKVVLKYKLLVLIQKYFEEDIFL